MNMCRHHGIMLWGIKREQTVEFSISIQDFKRIKSLAHKTKLRPQIQKKKGFPFLIFKMKKNWTFYSGMLIFFILLHFMSSFVWKIQFQGQVTYTKETLLKTIHSLQIYQGMKRKNLHCDMIEKNIRQKHPDISWVSAEEKGSLLMISIKEANKEVGRERQGRICHLTAAHSGVVKKIIVNRGIACVSVGQKVKKGQILISGIVPVKGDDDVITEKIGVVAKGKVEIISECDFSKEIPIKVKRKSYTGKIIHQIEFEINDKTFTIKNPMKRFDKGRKYDIITTILPYWDDLPIPVTCIKREKVFYEYEMVWHKRNRRELSKEAERLYKKMLRICEQKKWLILAKEATLTKQNDSLWFLKGHIRFVCNKTEKQYIADSELEIEQKAEDVKDGDS